ncbi:MAG: hypothetical protein GW858_01640 [Sphingomonadales bacterium]|nr:hypothetical protein [Sphingomonadales bacterium]NCQ22601.1 hypothetical protein [Sphingomonadales bacterium]NCT04043.1 hypothetical protein [Sphingomonadales bacterium]
MLRATGPVIISGLHPLDQLACAFAWLRRGEAQALEGDYPAEIAPHPTDLDAV